jgi:hypothetical protein
MSLDLLKLSCLALMLLVAAPASAAAKKDREACPEGQVSVKGACVAACPSTGPFASPADCECPAGYGKVLRGDGQGECGRLACRVGVRVDPKLCDCPPGSTLKTVGKASRCVSRTAGAKAK